MPPLFFSLPALLIKLLQRCPRVLQTTSNLSLDQWLINCGELFPKQLYGLFPACTSSPESHSHTHKLLHFIIVIAHAGEDIVIQGIICLIGAISQPLPLCQMAVFPQSLPLFAVTCNGKAFPATQGLTAQQWRVFQSLFGVLGLISAALSASPTCSSCCSFHWRTVWLCAGAPGPVVGQARLIEREGCSLLIRSDSSVLPEEGVPSHAENVHRKNSSVVKNTVCATTARAACQRNQMISSLKERRRPILYALINIKQELINQNGINKHQHHLCFITDKSIILCSNVANKLLPKLK